MLKLACPWCGPRDEIEFRCGGQSHLARPAEPDAVSDEAWGRYLSERINPSGLHLERWLHRAGCRRWFNVARDTRTHAIVTVYRMTEPPPVLLATVAQP